MTSIQPGDHPRWQETVAPHWPSGYTKRKWPCQGPVARALRGRLPCHCCQVSPQHAVEALRAHFCRQCSAASAAAMGNATGSHDGLSADNDPSLANFPNVPTVTHAATCATLPGFLLAVQRLEIQKCATMVRARVGFQVGDHPKTFKHPGASVTLLQTPVQQDSADRLVLETREKYSKHRITLTLSQASGLKHWFGNSCFGCWFVASSCRCKSGP